MAMEWSHSAEGIDNARDNLAKLDTTELIVIYAEWRAAQGKHGDISWNPRLDQRKYKRALPYATKLAELSHDALVNFIWDKAAELRTCDNGGFELWMCPFGCGCHMVTPGPTDDDGNSLENDEEDD